MIKDSVSIVINQPIEKVFEYVSDIARSKEWQEDLIEAKKTSEGPTGVGTTFTYVRQLLGRKVEAPGQITEYVPNRRWTIESKSGPLQFKGTYALEPGEMGTTMTFSYEGEAGGFFKLAEGVLASTVKKQTQGDFGRLKELLESK